MTLSFLPFFVVACLTLADATCIGPKMPGPTFCAECEDVRGTQCVSHDRWFSCFRDFGSCCNDWSIKNVQPDQAKCIADSEAFANAEVIDPNAVLPSVTNEFCQKVVTTFTSQTNAECMTLCDDLITRGQNPVNDPVWSERCKFAHYETHNGRTVVDEDGCFERWIYGYSQEVHLASIDENLVVDTPALCQLHCQLNDECVNWAWVSELYESTGSERVGRCLLKNRLMVETALSIPTHIEHPPNMDKQFCNVRLPLQCMTNHYNCAPCGGGDKRCVWESHMHVTGWKYCIHTDRCDPFATPLSTTTWAATTKVSTTVSTAAPTPEPTTTTTEPTTSTTTEPTTTTTEPTTTPEPTTSTTTEPTTTTTEPTTTPEPTTTTTVPTTTPEPTTTTTAVQDKTTTTTYFTLPGTVAASTTFVEPTPGPTPAPTTTSTALPGTVAASTAFVEIETPEWPQTPESTPLGPLTHVPEGTKEIVTSPTTTTVQRGDTTTGISLDVIPTQEPEGSESDDDFEATPKECIQDSPEAETEEPEECVKGSEETTDEECVPKRPSCSDRCECRGRPRCHCCVSGQLFIRVADRPKRLRFDLEN